MDSIKQNNEKTYTLGPNFEEVSLNDNSPSLFGVHILSNENFSANNVICEIPPFENSLIIRLVAGKIQTLILFCLGLNCLSVALLQLQNNEAFIEQTERMVRGIIRDINFLEMSEIQELLTLYKHNSEHIIDKIPKLTPLKKILNVLKNRLKHLRIEVKQPKNAKLISNKVFQYLTKISEDLCHDSQIKADPINVSSKESEAALVTLEITDEEGYALSKPISQFDSNVLSAVYTLFYHGNSIFSAKDIYKILTGGSKRADMSPALLPEIESSLNRLKGISIKIDATDQAKHHKKYEIKKAILESYLLPLEKIQVIFKGSQQIETAYRLIKIPAIFEYSQCLKQFITIPITLLKLTKPTLELICLRIAVLKRVLCICHGNMKYNRLTFDTLLRKAGIEIKSQTQKQRYIQAVKQTLELLKEQKLITNYTTTTESKENKKGRPALHGFQIVPIFKNKELNSPS